MNAVVTGAGRGLGLEFVRQLLPHTSTLFATVRNPGTAKELHALTLKNTGKLHVITLDVADETAIHEAVKQIAALTPSLDLLINNAGMYLGRPGAVSGSDRLGQLTMESGVATLRTNAVGPMVLTQELLPLLRKGRQPRIVSLTSGLGSIAQSSGAPFHYSASKAALNMYMHGLAAALRRDGIISVVINPGWVATDMGGGGASLSAHDSARSILRVVEKLTLEQTGSFLNYRGEIEPW
jgi:NAD(P)-dependent dehydrogenase (short-subunit alcohol dehydrogenase family)